MNLRSFKQATIAVAMATSLTGLITTTARSETWNYYTYAPSAKFYNGIALDKFAKDVDTQTGGKLKIRINWGGSLPISVTDISQAVSDNIIQMGSDVFNQGFLPLGGVLRLPMLMTSNADYRTALKIVEPVLSEGWAKAGVTLLGSYTYPRSVIYSQLPVKHLSDLAGKKMRVLSEPEGEFVKSFGGIPVTITTPEVSTALQQGVVDAISASTAVGGELWGPLVSYKYALGPGYVPVFFIANTARFNALPKDEQDTVRKLAAKMGDDLTDAMEEAQPKIDEMHRAKGMVITAADPADIAEYSKKMVPVWENWAKKNGPEADALLKKVREALSK